jgi:hypothetical protein
MNTYANEDKMKSLTIYVENVQALQLQHLWLTI